MRVLPKLAWLALIAALFCSNATLTWGQEINPDTVVGDHYRGYHVLRLAEREPDTRAFILKHFKSNSDPSVVHADFDGDGHPDYAILLKSDTSGMAKLVILLCDASTQCRGVREDDITRYSEEAYLSPLPVGSQVAGAASAEGENQSHPVRLTDTGIQVDYFEKGSVAYYWDKKLKKIVAVATGE